MLVKDDYYSILRENIYTLQLSYYHRIKEYLSIGGYAGFGMVEEWIGRSDSNGMGISFERYTYSSLTGFGSKLYIIPLILKESIPRFDLYASSSIGLISMYTSTGENIVPKRGHYIDYIIMAGSSFYLTKKFGLLIEAGYRSYELFNGFNAKYGLSLRF